MNNKILLSITIKTDDLESFYTEYVGRTPAKFEMTSLIDSLEKNEHSCNVKELPSNLLEYIRAIMTLNDAFIEVYKEQPPKLLK